MMKKSVFSQRFVVLLLFSAFLCWASVSISEAAAMGQGIDAPVPSKDPAAIEAVKKVERDMGDAMVAGDMEKLKQIYADDFASVGSSGEVTTKQNLVSDFKSFHDKLDWYETGPMDVQVFGNFALAQGSVKEKRSRNGKDSGGQFLWQDLLQKRAGKWMVCRSAAARVPEGQAQDPVLVATMKKLEQDLGDAMVAVDIDKINQAYADDWATIGWSSGQLFTKQGLLSDFKSGNHKLVGFALGPVDAQVLGDVAVVQASVTEKRIQDGKDISGQFVFMDLLRKREGKWVIVRSSAAKVS
jgi:ketosteroid isomerase-like protein